MLALNLTALVVEDDALIRQATARAFRQDGFACDVAENGNTALKKMRESKFDVAIVDLQMPLMNGHELVVQTLEMKDRPVIIVLTGVPDRRLVRDLFSRGVEDVVAKPANYDILTSKAKALIEQRMLAVAKVESEADRLIRQLSQCPVQELASDSVETPTEPNSQTITPTIQNISLENLPVNCILAEDVLDAHGRLLVREGSVLTLEIKNRLAALAKSVRIREPIKVHLPVAVSSSSVSNQLKT